jgi:hypothetical protein
LRWRYTHTHTNYIYIYLYIYIYHYKHTYIQEINLDTFDGFVLECVLLIECIFLIQEFDLDAFDAFCVLVANTECDAGSGRTHSSKRIHSKEMSFNTERDAVSTISTTLTRPDTYR